VTFEKGQKVLLSTKNISLKGPGVRKLMPKYIGPYRITELVGPVAYKLQLPLEMKIHPVFHVSMLKEWKGTGGGVYNPPAAYFMDGQAYWNVDEIIGHRDKKVGRHVIREYLVKWEGYGIEDATYEAEGKLREQILVAQEIEKYLSNQDMRQNAAEKRRLDEEKKVHPRKKTQHRKR
jgi:hypothetical protein